MKDTPSKIGAKFRAMLLDRSGEDRLKMGCSMHATSQALVRASVFKQYPDATPAVLKQALFLRFYGNDFEPGARKRILRALREAGKKTEAETEGERESKKPK